MIYVVYRKSDNSLVGAFDMNGLIKAMEGGELNFECKFFSEMPQ